MICYILRGKITKCFKVGITIDLANRLTAYRGHSAEEVVPVFICHVVRDGLASEWEAETLRKYRPFKLHGEWLRSDCPIIDEIKSGNVTRLLSDEIKVPKRRHQTTADLFREAYAARDVAIRLASAGKVTGDVTSEKSSEVFESIDQESIL